MSAENSVMDAAMMGDWDGNPRIEPDYYVKIWDLGDFFFVASSDGVHRVANNDGDFTLEDAIATVPEQLRILMLPEFRSKREEKKKNNGHENTTG